MKFSIVVIFLTVFSCLDRQLISCYKFNITNFENCQDVQPTGTDEHFPVELVSVKYVENSEGFVDVLRGTYVVKTIDLRDQEMLLTTYQCPKNFSTASSCNRNAKHYVESLNCTRFFNDDTGPWFIISSAMNIVNCGDMTGTFQLNDVKLSAKYLENYLQLNTDLPRFRLRILTHKKGEAVDDVHIRYCINLEFDVITR